MQFRAARLGLGAWQVVSRVGLRQGSWRSGCGVGSDGGTRRLGIADAVGSGLRRESEGRGGEDLLLCFLPRA